MSYDTCVAIVLSLLEESFTWDTIDSWVKISQRTLEYTLFDGTIDVILPLEECTQFFEPVVIKQLNIKLVFTSE